MKLLLSGLLGMSTASKHKIRIEIINVSLNKQGLKIAKGNWISQG